MRPSDARGMGLAAPGPGPRKDHLMFRRRWTDLTPRQQTAVLVLGVTLAHAQLEIQAWNDAKSTLRTFIRRFPTSAHINEAKGKLAEVSLYH